MGFYMENKENERMILDSSQNGPLVWPTITEEDGTTRKKTYAELSASEKLKRHRNAAWCKKKAMLAEAQEAGQILDEEQLAFLADPSILDGQTAQTTIPNTIAFQTEDLDAYDCKCDDVSNAKVVPMAYLSNYGLDVISK
nr:hypothetical protein [Tanacetum cinerariifolium]GEZ88716.1 hypothetical protein [Tanacetum cinerariifolium]